MNGRAALRRAAEWLDRDNDEGSHAVAAGIRRFLDGEAATLDAALALAPPPADIALRNQLIVAACAAYWPAARPLPAARFLVARLQRYAAGPWEFERFATACPPAREGRLDGMLWEILRAAPEVPSVRTVRRILATVARHGQQTRATSIRRRSDDRHHDQANRRPRARHRDSSAAGTGGETPRAAR